MLRLQEYLHTLGYYNGKLSGNYLEGTTSAIKSFQEKNALTATGEADVGTQRRLFSSSAISKDAPETTVAPNPGNDLGDTNDVVIASDGDKDTTPADAEYTTKLKRGAKGEQVKLVQQRLTDLGYFSGPISGNYMNQTVEAVKAFQLNNGLKADGVTGEDTWTILFGRSAGAEQRRYRAPRLQCLLPCPTPSPWM